MKNVIEGTVFAFGRNIDTDQIYPGRFVEYTEVEDIRKYAMHGADPTFAERFKPGDIIVAASNFGCGSSREHAAITLKAVGVSVIIAESFGRIFFRNAINLGIAAVTCKNICEIAHEGDTLEIDILSGKIRNVTTGETGQADPLSDYIIKILESGGIKPMIYQMQMEKKKGK